MSKRTKTAAENKQLNEELEQRVRERTRELAATNEELRREISARQHIEAALRELTENMAAAQRLAHFGSWKVDLTPELAFVSPQFWSDECYHILGVAPGSTAISEAFFYHCVHPDDRAFVAQALQHAIAERAETAYQYRLVRPDGTIRYLYDQVKVVVDESTGRPISILGTVRDITERKQAEAQLHTQSARLKILADASQAFATIGLDDQALLNLVVRQTATVFGDLCAIHLISADGDWLHPVMVYDPAPERLAAVQAVVDQAPLRIDGTELVVRVARTGEPALMPFITQAEVQATMRPEIWQPLAHFHFHSALIVPLRVQGRSIGALTLSRARPDQPAFTADDLTLAQDLADRAALALSNARLITQAQAELAERRRAEEQLRYQADLLANVSDAIISTDLAFRIRSWNRAAEIIYGWSAAEVIGREMSNMVPTEYLEPDVLQKFQQAGHWRGEVTQVAKDGTKRAIMSSVTQLRDESGQPTGAVAVNRDITEQVAAAKALQVSQQLIQSTLNSLSAQICVLDETGTIIAVNNLWKSFAQANGANMARVCEGVNYLQICEATQGEERQTALAFAAGIRAVAEGQCDYFEFEYPCHSVQEQRWFIERVTPLIGSPASLRRVVVAHENITALKQLEAENERLSAQFFQAQKMESIGRLAGGIAHDFNNLLMPIIGYSELGMLKLAADSRLHADLKRIKDAGERAARLTRQILAFSRQQLLEMKALDLNLTIREFEPMLRRLIGEDINLVLHLAATLPTLIADQGQLEQVVLNLIVNARDAMPDGGTISIETAPVVLDAAYTAQHPEMEPGSYALLSISDTGCGMDAATQQHIFEPFFTTKPQGHGTGLGLSTVFGIIKQHGGNIWVYSEPTYGTTFKIYLPLAAALPPTAPAVPLAAARLDGTETVLLVEDDLSVRQLVGDTLRTHGYQLLEAGEPAQALLLAAAHAGPIDLLLSDVIMPQMNGRKLYQQLATVRPGLKVLFMSGYTDNVIAPHYLWAEKSAFLQKPFAIADLLQTVRSVLT